MENKKQSSVEWLIEELNHNIEFIPLAHWDKIRDIVQQAKAIHKEEIKDAYDAVIIDENGGLLDGKEYYKETFGGQDNE